MHRNPSVGTGEIHGAQVPLISCPLVFIRGFTQPLVKLDDLLRSCHTPPVSKRRNIIIILLACGVFIAAAVFFIRHDREPSYQGRSLTEWMTAYNVASSAEETDEATKAIRQLGTNAIPHLLKWIQ